MDDLTDKIHTMAMLSPEQRQARGKLAHEVTIPERWDKIVPQWIELFDTILKNPKSKKWNEGVVI